MARKLLENTFGFDSRCFVCDPANAGGIRQQMYLDDELERIVCDFTPRQDLSGAPNYAHGGAVMALLDDAMAWAVIALKERFGVSRHIEFDFSRPVMIGHEYTLQAWAESLDGRDLAAKAELLNASGKTCVAATGTFTVMTFEEAKQAIGAGAGSAKSYTEEQA